VSGGEANKVIGLADIGREPFRIFFPAGLLAGLVGVSLWPLHFTHVLELYPGLAHARIMACGFFGGFIVGFLGTAMPRMLSANPLRVTEVVSLVLLHVAMVIAYALSRVLLGDILFIALLLFFARSMAVRARQRKDLPPPGFVLVGLAIINAASGSILSVALMLLGMATRISGDFWPAILASHYIYGAVLWVAGVLLWSVYVLPKVLIADQE